jgi:hypothetical protein
MPTCAAYLPAELPQAGPAHRAPLRGECPCFSYVHVHVRGSAKRLKRCSQTVLRGPHKLLNVLHMLCKAKHAKLSTRLPCPLKSGVLRAFLCLCSHRIAVQAAFNASACDSWFLRAVDKANTDEAPARLHCQELQVASMSPVGLS